MAKKYDVEESTWRASNRAIEHAKDELQDIHHNIKNDVDEPIG